MAQQYDGNHEASEEGKEDLEQLLLQGVTLHDTDFHDAQPSLIIDEDDGETAASQESDLQGALGLFAEGSQDMATAGVELALGRHFACVDFCNQAAEKAAQAVSLLRFGHRSMYNHDLRALAFLVGAPDPIQDDMARLTPFHPETFYVETPPEEADEIIDAEQASSYMQSARNVLRWARDIILRA